MVINEISRISDPRLTRPVMDKWRSVRTSSLDINWWIAWLLGVAFFVVGQVLHETATYGEALASEPEVKYFVYRWLDTREFRFALHIMLTGFGLCSAAAAMGAIVVKRLSRRLV